MGFKNFKEFNDALLFKWNWRILQGDDWLWAKVLAARYDNIKHDVSYLTIRRSSNSKSTWWSDCLRVESCFSNPVFSDNCEFIMGGGCDIPF